MTDINTVRYAEALAAAEAEIARLKAEVAQTQAAQPIAEEWKLVPVEPTKEMLDAGLAELRHHLGDTSVIVRDAGFCYRAMLHAAPQEPAR